METKEKFGVLEAIIFASGEPVDIYHLSQASGIDMGAIPPMIRMLNERYDDCGSGICIKILGESYQMCTREKFEPYIRNALETKKNTPLSNAAMEVLTIIAYNQPVSRGFIENVRGIESSSVVSNLIEKGLIEDAGRLNIPGKPLVYRTTANFLRCFGLRSLSELPPLENYKKSEQLEFESYDDEETGDN